VARAGLDIHRSYTAR